MSFHDGKDMSRRDLLAAMARIGAAAPLALSTAAAAAQSPRPPANVRVLTADSLLGTKAVLTPNDISFLGYIRFSGEHDLWYTYGQLALRRAGGQLRAFTAGNVTDNYPLLEYTLPDTPNASVAAAPFATLTRNWGTVGPDRLLTGGSLGAVMGGLYWDQGRNALWWSYGDSYVPVQKHPTLGCAVLNDSAGTAKFCGPWRTEWQSQRTRGAFCSIPDTFASTSTSGKNVGIMSSITSGSADSPWGANLSAMSLPDPLNTPADVITTDTHWTVANQGLIFHDLDHRQKRDTRYKACGWATPYQCAGGATLEAGIPLFGGPRPASNSDDTMSSCVWIDLPDKHGLLYFGQLVGTPQGYTAPGDPDGLTHQWYGAAFHNSSPSGITQACCHNQDDPYWNATGPGTHYRVAKGWIYNPTQLIDTARGSAALWSRTPTSEFEWAGKLPSANGRIRPGFFSGSVFDPLTKRIYIVLNDVDAVTAPPRARPAIGVFEVR